MAKSCTTRIINDEPYFSDLLGGAHDRLANAIIHAIQCEKGGKTIGIEGEWGSGKSTVIQLLQNKAKEKNIEVFIFDAWAHSGDPLRRTFLEKLIDFAQNSFDVDKTAWDTKKGIISGTKTIIETKNEPKITYLGKWIIFLSAVMLPIGLIVISNAINSGISLDSSMPAKYDLYLGLLLFLSPFILLAISTIAIENEWKKILNFLKLPNNDDPWMFYINKGQTHSTIKSQSTPNPTSVEFEKYFIELLTDALTEGEKKLVIVFDNLDRVNPDEALSLISTMQTFFQCRADSNSPISRLWIIVPYDVEGLKRLWKTDISSTRNIFDNNNKEKEKTTQDAIEKSDIENEKISLDSLAESMLNKRFQIRYRIPPVALSSWKEYFIKQISIAFPNHTDTAFHNCYRIYKNLCNISHSPTPRDINIYINQMGTIHRQWDTPCEFPLEHIAYFIGFIKDKGNEEIESALIHRTSLPKYIDNSIDLLVNNLVMMYFNTTSEKSLELLLRNRIINCLQTEQLAELQRIQVNHPAGFWAVLETIESELVEFSQPDILSTILCFHKIYNNKNLFVSEHQSFINSIQSTVFSITKWDEVNEHTGEILATLLSWSEYDPQHVKGTLKSLAQSLPIVKESEVSATLLDDLNIKIQKYKNGVLKIISIPKISKHVPEEPIALTPINQFSRIEFLSSFSFDSTYAQFKSFFSFEESLEEIESLIISMVKNGWSSGRHVNAIKILIKEGQITNWDNIIDGIIEHLNSNPTHFYHLLEILWNIHSQGEYGRDVFVSKLGKPDSSLFSLLSIAEDLNDNLGAAWIVFIYLYFSGQKPSPPTSPPLPPQIASGQKWFIDTVLSKSPPADLIDQLIKILSEYGMFKNFMDITIQTGDLNPLSSILLMSVINKGRVNDLIPSQYLVSNWKKIKTLIAIDQWKLLLHKKFERSDLVPTIIQSEFLMDDCEFYSNLLQTGCKIDNSFFDFLATGMDTLSKDDWKKELQSKGSSIEIIKFMVIENRNIQLRISYHDALCEIITESINNYVAPPIQDDWQTLKKALEVSLHNNLYKGIFDELENVAKIPDWIYDYLDDMTLIAGIISNDQNILRKIITQNIVALGDVIGLNWLIKLFKENISLYKSIRKHADYNAFVARIEDMAEKDPVDGSENIYKKLIGLLHLNNKKKK